MGISLLAPRRRGLAPAAKPKKRARAAVRLLQLAQELRNLDRELSQLDASCDLSAETSVDVQDVRLHARALRSRLIGAALTLTAD